MKKTDTTRVIMKSGDRRVGATDWAALDALEERDVLKAANDDPDARQLDSSKLAGMRRVSKVKALRERLGMTQTAFAAAFHLPITTLRDWEQRRSTPDAPARALLLAIERNPELMRDLLREPA